MNSPDERSATPALPALEQKPSPEQVDLITRAFLRIFEAYAHPGAFVADESDLPFPKARIDQALLHSLKRTSDEPTRRKLGLAYLSLADWQPRVGRLLSKGQLSAEASGKLNASQIQQLAAQFSELMKWERIVAEERESRADNLKALALA
jgi:hypothetical protein